MKITIELEAYSKEEIEKASNLLEWLKADIGLGILKPAKPAADNDHSPRLDF